MRSQHPQDPPSTSPEPLVDERSWGSHGFRATPFVVSHLPAEGVVCGEKKMFPRLFRFAVAIIHVVNATLYHSVRSGSVVKIG